MMQELATLPAIQWDEYTDDLGPHKRATFQLNGKNVCIVNKIGSVWFSVWVGKAASVVREDKLWQWIQCHL